MRRDCPVTAVTTLLSTGAVIATMLLFLVLQERSTSLLLPFVWLCFGPLLYGLDALLLRRERSVLALILCNGLLGLMLAVTVFLTVGCSNSLEVIVLVLGCSWLSYQSASLHLHPLQLSTVIQWLDISLLVLMLFTAYLAIMDLALLYALPVAIGCCASIFGMMEHRAGGEMTTRDRALLSGLLAVILGVAIFVTSTVIRPVGSGVTVLWQRLQLLAARFYQALTAFLLWLSSLFPSEGSEALNIADDTSAMSTSVGGEAIQYQIPLAFWVVVGILLLVVLILLLRYARGFRIGRGKRVTVQKNRRERRLSLWQAILLAFRQFAEVIRLNFYLIRYRGTPLGQFYALLRKRYGRNWRLGCALSPREFLQAEAEAAADNREKERISALIDAVEMALFCS